MFRVAALAFSLAVACFGVLPPALIERGEDNLTFDRASKIEILSFAKTILSRPPLTADLLAQKIDLKPEKINMISVLSVRDRMLNALLDNYLAASDKAGENPTRSDAEARLRELVKDFVIEPKRERFYNAYFYELIRLAALFPKTSSEIDRFNDAEILGGELNDREFILTFDDGPTEKNGLTDKLVQLLNERNQSAIFFVLGENAAKRQNELAKLYANQRLASHGWRHESHAKTPNAKESILRTDDLLSVYAKEVYINAFRPPYAQRDADLGAFLAERNISLVLWNIDSQDWQSAVSAKAAADRVLTLMLLWRKGVILFHDTHDKALNALPILFKQTLRLGVTFSV
ncbi:MAG: polysaccharide deacetylase family protein [Helicobacteraceae bacterium]|jgi:peptidoglycan/xylan/chitin deacetylase (PgdA/CDA1 family)|nr:polysaccharide deacetylase family protein [Helicobacteraceae bacterium]